MTFSVSIGQVYCLGPTDVVDVTFTNMRDDTVRVTSSDGFNSLISAHSSVTEHQVVVSGQTLSAVFKNPTTGTVYGSLSYKLPAANTLVCEASTSTTTTIKVVLSTVPPPPSVETTLPEIPVVTTLPSVETTVAETTTTATRTLPPSLPVTGFEVVLVTLSGIVCIIVGTFTVRKARRVT